MTGVPTQADPNRKATPPAKQKAAPPTKATFPPKTKAPFFPAKAKLVGGVRTSPRRVQRPGKSRPTGKEKVSASAEAPDRQGPPKKNFKAVGAANAEPGKQKGLYCSIPEGVGQEQHVEEAIKLLGHSNFALPGESEVPEGAREAIRRMEEMSDEEWEAHVDTTIAFWEERKKALGANPHPTCHVELLAEMLVHYGLAGSDKVPEVIQRLRTTWPTVGAVSYPETWPIDPDLAEAEPELSVEELLARQASVLQQCKKVAAGMRCSLCHRSRSFRRAQNRLIAIGHLQRHAQILRLRQGRWVCRVLCLGLG
jgi:hypothetical protein